MRWFVALLLLTWCTAGIQAESLDARFMAGLRARHLYRLAEVYGNDRWQRDDLSDRERTELAIQLAMVHTDHALASPPESRDPLWAKADAACAALVSGWPDNPRRPLVEVQRALIAFARGEQLRDEMIGAAAADAATALEHLRAAARRLAEVAQALEKRLIAWRLRPPADSSPDALTVDELDSLAAHVGFHLARTQRQIGLCYPPRSADRDDGLLQAVDRLTPLARQTAADELVWNARVELVACQRELGRLAAAERALDAWSQAGPPPDVAARLDAQRVRLLVADGRTADAAEFAQRAQQAAGDAVADLALARLEATLGDWRRARESNRTLNARPLIDQLDAIRSRHGPYWARRAQLLVGGALAAGGGAGDAASLVLAAEHLYLSGDVRTALANYDRAVEMLGRQQQHEQAFSTAMTAAAIDREAGHFAAAAKRYLEMAARQPNHPRAAEAHLRAILATADLLRESQPADRTELLANYEGLLAEHLTHWPQGTTANDARQWLGQLLAGRSAWPEAVQVLQPTPSSSPHYADAVQMITDAYQRQLERLDGKTDDASRRTRAELLAAARNSLQPVITGPDNRWPAEWNDAQRDTALALARFYLRFADEPSDYAEQLLVAALRGPPGGAGDSVNSQQYVTWQARAQALLVGALARSGKAAEARTIVSQMAGGPADALLETLAGVDEWIGQLPPAADQGRRALGQLALELVRAIDPRRNDLDATAVARLRRYQAAALAAVGERAAALARFAELAEAAPDDGDLQERYAALLAASESTTELRDALARWREVEQRSRRGGPRWRRARQARIDLLTRLGEPEEADKLLRLTRLLYPKWDREL